MGITKALSLSVLMNDAVQSNRQMSLSINERSRFSSNDKSILIVQFIQLHTQSLSSQVRIQLMAISKNNPSLLPLALDQQSDDPVGGSVSQAWLSRTFHGQCSLRVLWTNSTNESVGSIGNKVGELFFLALSASLCVLL